MNVALNDKYRTSRLLYIIEAALEYFVAIAVGTVYLGVDNVYYRICLHIAVKEYVAAVLEYFPSHSDENGKQHAE